MARVSVLSKQIITILESSHLLSVGEIISSLQKKYNKTSVYRALEKLQLEGLVCKESFGESESKYELRSNHHDHAFCTNCEKIIQIDCQSHRAETIPGFAVDHHHTTIFGICESCNKKEKKLAISHV